MTENPHRIYYATSPSYFDEMCDNLTTHGKELPIYDGDFTEHHRTFRLYRDPKDETIGYAVPVAKEASDA